MLAALLVLIGLGVPMAWAMGGVGSLFTIFLWGPDSLFGIVGRTMGWVGNFTILAVPLFILMSVILEKVDLAEDLFDAVYKWAGGLRGGLAVATIIVCTNLAAMTGIVAGAIVAMGVVALPAMRKRQYDKQMSVGSILAGGTLGILIPPSIIIVTYALFSGLSVGKLLIGGIIPGLLLSGMYIVYIIVRCFIQKDLCPAPPKEERASWGEKITSLRNIILPCLLIIAVLGAIFSGIATPTEAAGVGAVGSIICGLVLRRLTWKKLYEACMSTMTLSTYIMWIILSATFFAQVFTATGGIDLVSGIITALPFGKYGILAIMLLILLVLGMFIDSFGIIAICVPIFMPIITAFKFDPLWFGVLFNITMQIAYISPPFGYSLFALKAVAPPDVTTKDVLMSAIPFIAIQLICLLLIIFFPQIGIWLPNLMLK
jgi:tripartite ATP-independent transporter DctM subunit